MSMLEDSSHLPLSNRPETIIGVVVTFLCVTTLAVCLRLFVRFKERIWGWDDMFVVLAGASCVAASIITCHMPSEGLGKHFWTLDDYTKMQYFKYIWASNLLYSLSTTFIKLSILAQYLRLFQGRTEAARKITWGMIILVACWGLTFGLLAIFSCTPVAKNWDFTLSGRCVGWGSKNPNEFFATWIGHASSNMLLDTLILALPVPFIRKLRMSGKTRTGLIALFTLGGIAVILSVARVIALSIRRIGTIPVFDPSFATPIVYIFSALELNMAILTASIPIFWPLVTSLAANKILIVKEIEIRTERVDQTYALADQGKGFAGIEDEEEVTNDRTADGRTSRISMFGKPDTDRHHRMNNGSNKHRTKLSDSSDNTLSGHRSSQESQRKLNLTHQSFHGSFSSFNNADRLESSPDHTHARYKNKFMQDWAVPDFEAGAPKGGGPGGVEQTFTTSVERAEIPYDHIRAMEK